MKLEYIAPRTKSPVVASPKQKKKAVKKVSDGFTALETSLSQRILEAPAPITIRELLYARPKI